MRLPLHFKMLLKCFLQSFAKPAIKRVIVFRHDGLGDWLLWLDAARRLREFYPKGKFHITLIGSPMTSELNKLCPYWDDSIDRYSRNWFKHQLLHIRELYALLMADVLINPVSNQNSAGVAKYSAADERICLDFRPNEILKIPKETLGENLSCYTRLVKVDPNDGMINVNGIFADSITGKVEQHGIDGLSFVPDIVPPYKDYLLVAPGAAVSRRCWDPEKFAEIACKGLEDGIFKTIIICGSAGDRPLVERLMAANASDGSFINLCGRTSTLELFGLVRHAKAVLCNESGCSHLAALYGTHSVCILGGGHFGYYHPYPEELLAKTKCHVVFNRMDCYGCKWSCCVDPDGKGPFPCIAKISVDDVLSAMHQALDYRSAK